MAFGQNVEESNLNEIRQRQTLSCLHKIICVQGDKQGEDQRMIDSVLFFLLFFFRFRESKGKLLLKRESMASLETLKPVDTRAAVNSALFKIPVWRKKEKEKEKKEKKKKSTNQENEMERKKKGKMNEN